MDFICAHCHALVSVQHDSVDNGTTLTCFKCGKLTVLALMTPDDHKALSRKNFQHILGELEKLAAKDPKWKKRRKTFEIIPGLDYAQLKSMDE